MSMITEQVKLLKIQGDLCKLSGAFDDGKLLYDAADTIEQLAAKVREENAIIHCKECAHFEYDVVKNVDGIPLIVAHEMCSRWGDGCKTTETGFCFLALAKEKEDKTE